MLPISHASLLRDSALGGILDYKQSAILPDVSMNIDSNEKENNRSR